MPEFVDHLIIINDASSDNTLAIIKEKIPNRLSPKNLAIMIFWINNNRVPILVNTKENILWFNINLLFHNCIQ